MQDRAYFKMYYCQIRPAPVLTLGKNPGGNPNGTSPDGCTNLDSGSKAASSAGFFENDEHDTLNCEWRENQGLRKLLLPLFSGDENIIRREVVKTNVAFQRSATISKHQTEFETICAPYLEEIIEVVRPGLILLTGQIFPNLHQRSVASVSPWLMQ